VPAKILARIEMRRRVLPGVFRGMAMGMRKTGAYDG